ncbi:uncharacterized protein ACIB01_017837 isoform 1-T1 [Guaruba guarouba]
MAIIPSPHLPSPLASLHPITFKRKGLCGAGRRRLFLLSSCVNATISLPSDGGSDSPAGWRRLRRSRMIRGEPELGCKTGAEIPVTHKTRRAQRWPVAAGPPMVPAAPSPLHGHHWDAGADDAWGPFGGGSTPESFS